MKKVLCYGDSNTFGFNPANGSRFDENTRWTALLQKNLGENYKVIDEGANNRMGFLNNPSGFLYSSQKHFPSIISKNKDIDFLVLAIGTNDLQFRYDIDFKEIEAGLRNLLFIAKENVKTTILIPPIILNENIFNGYFKTMFNETSIAKSKLVGGIYRQIANEFDSKLFDLNEFVKPSSVDGLHYDESSHKLIAENLADIIKIYNQ